MSIPPLCFRHLWMLILFAFLPAHVGNAQYKIDIDSTFGGGPLSTEAGWTSLDATNGNAGTVNVGGITFQPFSAASSRVRTSGGVATPNNLTGDFAFDDGPNAAVGLLFGGAGSLPAGDWQVKLWIWDAGAAFGNSIVGFRTNSSETIISTTVAADPVNPAITFTFTSDGSSSYDVFVRENNTENRSRLCAVELSTPDGPTDIALSGNLVSKSAAVGTQIGTFSTTDPTPADSFTYSLATGTGSGDNSRFAINGSALEVDSDLSALNGGDVLSARVRSTDQDGAYFEKVFLITLVNDSDNDGLDDDWELAYFPNLMTASGSGNNDADSLTNLQEQAAGTSPILADTDGDTVDDDLEDGSLVYNGPTNPGSSPLLQDTDFDGIRDDEEISAANGYITDPTKQDTDGDGYPDPFEIAEGTDPTNGANFPNTLIPLRINEVLANNVNGLQDGFTNKEDWIEIYNPNNQPFDLTGFFMTDNAALLMKWSFPSVSIPASDYLVVFASGKNLTDGSGNIHTNFSLSAQGEYLAIVRPNGTTIDDEFTPTFPKQFPDISYGVHPSNLSLRYFSTRTPGAANNTGFDDVVRDTSFSADRGFYDDPFPVTISTTTIGATIRYTTDGSKPSETSGTLYTDPVQITTTTTLRAIAYKAGTLSTNVDSHTYIFVDDVAQQSNTQPGYPTTWGSIAQGTVPADYEMDPRVVNNTLPGYSIRDALLDIPTMSISMPPGDFLGTSTSIYDHSQTRGAAYEKECSIELIYPDGTKGFQENCQIEMHGNSSRNPYRMQKHSMRLTFKAELGAAKLRYPLFPTTKVDEFNKIVLRACFTDSWGLASWGAGRYRPNDSQYIRDVWMKNSMGDMGNPTSHSTFAHLYVNGIYWGLHNPAERLEDDTFAAHEGGSKEDWEVYADFSGPGSHYQAMSAINAATIAGYAQIQNYLDLENTADYFLLHLYADAEDWPTHNGYAATNINPATGDLKYRYYVWDQEIALDKFSWNRYDDARGGAASVFQELLQNPEFQLLFADRIHKHLFNGGALTLENSRARYLGLANQIDKAIVAESARWGDVAATTPYGDTPGNSTEIDNDNYPPTINNPIYFTREQHWIVERDNVLNHYLAVLHDENDSRSFINELRAENLYPSIDAPKFTQHGGFISSPFDLHMLAADTVWYTTNGEDPRLPGGSVNPNASSYTPNSSIITEALVGENPASPTTLFTLVPTDGTLGITWTQAVFTEAGWNTSAASDLGVGYERTPPGDYSPEIDRDVSGTMMDENGSIYIRYEFNIADASAFESLALSMKYDDGFVAYLNGNLIDSQNPPAGALAWDSNSESSHEADVTTFDSTLSLDPALLIDGLNVLAIHGLNQSDGSSDFLIVPDLSGSRVETSNVPPIVLSGSQTVKARTLSAAEWSALTEAFFIADDLVISEIMYRPSTNGDAEFIELMNIGTQIIDLDGVSFSSGITFSFSGQSIAPGERLLIVRDLVVFESVYGAGLNVAGEYTGGLSNDGETIRLEADGTAIREFTYNDVAPWPEAADGAGRSLVLIAPETNPDHASPQNWRHSAANGGTPGGSDYSPFTGTTSEDLAAYAFSPNPPAISRLPGATSTMISISRQIGSDDVEISIEYSEDLNSWTNLGASLPVNSNTVEGMAETLTYEIDDSLGTGSERFFLRAAANLR